MQYPNQLAHLPLVSGDDERLTAQVADWSARAARLDRWVRDNVPTATPGITTVSHIPAERAS